MSSQEHDRTVLAAYNEMATTYAEKWCTEQVLRDELEYVEELVRLTDASEDRIIDVGCGPAVYYPLAQALRLDFVGIDFSAPMLHAGKALFPSCRLIRGDARCLPVSSGHFKMAIAMNSLSHLDDSDYAKALSEVRRVLLDGGAFFLSDQLGHGMKIEEYPLLPKHRIPVFARGIDTHKKFLAGANFDVIRTRVRRFMPGEIPHDKAMFWSIAGPR